MTAASFILIGGGGHARVVADCIRAQGGNIGGYIDPKTCAWLDEAGVARLSENQMDPKPHLAMGYVGLDCASLERRYRQMEQYRSKGAHFPTIIHPSAMVSPKAKLAEGVQVLPGAVVNAYAQVAAGAIINSRAVVEHDAFIGTGVHVAPSSVVLGGARVEEFSYIAAGAVVVQGSEVLPCSFIKALTVHK